MEEFQEIENQPVKEKEKKRNPFKLFGIILILLGILFYLYIHFIEPNMLVTHEYAIIDNNLPYSFHGIKIVHFSDILYGSTMNEKKLEKMVTKINQLKPDILVFTGDLFNSTIQLNDDAKNKLKEVLSKLTATYKKYAVIGDNDYIDKNSYMEIMESANFMILNNKSDLFYYGGNDPLLFLGTNSLLEKENDIEMANTNYEDISSAYKIWLNHEPIILDELLNRFVKPNLILTGHTLKGLMPLPFGGTLLKQNGVENYESVYYNKQDVKMYISSGLGTYKYNARFLNPPSINLYRLYQY